MPHPDFLQGAVVDSSAVISLLMKEPSELAFAHAFAGANYDGVKLMMSTPTHVELSLVAQGKMGITGIQLLDAFIKHFQFSLEPFTPELALEARLAAKRYGKGMNPASLNFGDLFSYALAKKLNVPLFYQGLDFLRTDIKDAMVLLGYNHDPSGHTPLPPTSQ